MEFPIKNAVDTIAYVALAVHLPDNLPSPDGERTCRAGADLVQFKEATPLEIEARGFSLGQQLYREVQNVM